MSRGEENQAKQKPDPLELRIRFGCGAIFGIAVGAFSAMRVMRHGWQVSLVVIIIAIACGCLAARYGDDFWWKALRF